MNDELGIFEKYSQINESLGLGYAIGSQNFGKATPNRVPKQGYDTYNTPRVKEPSEHEEVAIQAGEPEVEVQAVVSISDEYDETSDNIEMCRQELFKISKYSQSLYDSLESHDDIDAWILSKITKAADYISTVKHHLEYQQSSGRSGFEC